MSRVFAHDLGKIREARLSEVLGIAHISRVDERLAYACLECGSTGMAPTARDRDQVVKFFDMTCCNEETTVLFVSPGLDADRVYDNSKAESDPCLRGTDGCCIDHRLDSHDSCEAY